MAARLPVPFTGALLLACWYAVPAPTNAQVIATHRLPAALASQIVNGAIAACAKLNFPISAAVLDADGVLQAEVRGDGAGLHTIRTARDKAYTAITFHTTSAAVTKRVSTAPGIPSVVAKEPHLVADEGGVPILVGREVIGAVGVSGSVGKDEDCANAGIDLVRDQLR